MTRKNIFEIVMKVKFYKMSQLVTLFLSFLVLTCLYEARTECIRCRWKAYEVYYPEMITSYQGGNTSFSNFPFRAPFRTPRCLGWGGRISKGSDFAFMLYFCIYALLLFCASPFCDVQWLAGSPFYKAVILYSLLFQNLDPFSNQTFCGFAQPMV